MLQIARLLPFILSILLILSKFFLIYFLVASHHPLRRRARLLRDRLVAEWFFQQLFYQHQLTY